jgi:pyruvate kinase
MRRHEVIEELIADAVPPGDGARLGAARSAVAITAGLPSGRPGTTSLLQVQEV